MATGSEEQVRRLRWKTWIYDGEKWILDESSKKQVSLEDCRSFCHEHVASTPPTLQNLCGIAVFNAHSNKDLTEEPIRRILEHTKPIINIVIRRYGWRGVHTKFCNVEILNVLQWLKESKSRRKYNPAILEFNSYEFHRVYNDYKTTYVKCGYEKCKEEERGEIEDIQNENRIQLYPRSDIGQYI